MDLVEIRKLLKTLVHWIHSEGASFFEGPLLVPRRSQRLLKG